MHLLIIDHSTVSNEEWWPALRQAVETTDCRLALSVWNLVEIGFAADKAQRAQRLDFLKTLHPLWLLERLQIQKAEVKSFLWRHAFQVEPGEISPVSPHLSAVDHFLAESHARIGLTPERFIAEIDFDMLTPLKKETPAALRTLRTADKDKVRQVEKQMFDAWIGGLIPNANPHGKLLKRSEQQALTDVCYANKETFLAACRAIAAEDALSRARTSDPRRNPTESDGIDLQHAVVGVAYGTVFATADRYQGQCAQFATKMLGAGFATVSRDVKSLAADVLAGSVAAPAA